MDGAVRLVAMPEAARLAPGGRLTATLTVTNTGPRAARYHIRIAGIPVNWYDLDETSLTLIPGAAASVPLVVRVPVDASPDRHAVSVGITDADDIAVLTTAGIAIAVEPGGDLDMDVQPRQIEGRDAIVRVTFLNQSDRPATVTLRVGDDAGELEFALAPDRPVVVPAAAMVGPVYIRIVPRVSRWIGRAKRYKVTVRGIPARSDDVLDPSLVRQVFFTGEPRLVPARLPLTTVLLGFILAGVLALQWAADGAPFPLSVPAPTATPIPSYFPTAILTSPTIDDFSLEQAAPGDPYVLVWTMSGAVSATLNGQRVVTRGRIPLVAPVHSATYRLVAIAGPHHDEAGLQVIVRDPATHQPTPTPAAGMKKYTLVLPRIETFTVRRRSGKEVAQWSVRGATHVRLQGTPVPSHGQRTISAGAPALQLSAANAVGTSERSLHVSVTRHSGTSQSAALLNPDHIDFGSYKVGATSSAQAVRLVNLGPSAMIIKRISIGGQDAPDFREASGCPSSSIGVDDGCSITITFAPREVGTRRATLSIAGNLSGSPRAVALQGRGVR